MAERRGEPVTSEQLAASLMTNPVVVRRTIAGLREGGLVGSTPGHRGGWILRRGPEATTLREVYEPLDESLLAKASQVESPGCLVEQAISRMMHEVRDEAEALLVRRLGEKTLTDVGAAVKQLMKKIPNPTDAACGLISEER